MFDTAVLFWHDMPRQLEAEVPSGDEQGHRAERRSTRRTGAGKGGSLHQLQKVGDAITQEHQKCPKRSIPADEPVNKMAPSRPKAKAKKRDIKEKAREVCFSRFHLVQADTDNARLRSGSRSTPMTIPHFKWPTSLHVSGSGPLMPTLTPTLMPTLMPTLTPMVPLRSLDEAIVGWRRSLRKDTHTMVQIV